MSELGRWNHQSDANEEVCCTFCPSRRKPYKKLSDHPDIQILLKENNIDYAVVDGHEDYICYQCVYRFCKIREFLYLCNKNFIKSRINFFYRNGNTEMLNIYLKSTIPVPNSSENEDVQCTNNKSEQFSINNKLLSKVTLSNPTLEQHRSDEESGIYKNRLTATKLNSQDFNNQKNVSHSDEYCICSYCGDRYSCQCKQPLPQNPYTTSIKSVPHKDDNTNLIKKIRNIDSEDISVIDSMYSTKLRNVENWMYAIVDTNSVLSDNAEFVSESRLNCNEDWKIEATEIFYCPEPRCPFTETSLEKLYIHDIEEHTKNRTATHLFMCKKCKCHFVRKIYLDYHLRYQNEGLFVCYMCEETFSYEFDLKRHFENHRHLRNYTCEMCSLSFLCKEEFETHLESKKHLKRSQWELKSVCPTMRHGCSISKISKPYKTHIRILKTAKPSFISKYTFRLFKNIDLLLPVSRGLYNCIHSPNHEIDVTKFGI